MLAHSVNEISNLGLADNETGKYEVENFLEQLQCYPIRDRNQRLRGQNTEQFS
jgi:hypothetical protein